ncbi:MAG: tetratricopeptide repeat protein, partial [Candidatus Omnitrophica bacterium]|nr:tetratricopeptide repeat protein [Candidatus Omnitrophota bacterium]
MRIFDGREIPRAYPETETSAYICQEDKYLILARKQSSSPLSNKIEELFLSEQMLDLQKQLDSLERNLINQEKYDEAISNLNRLLNRIKYYKLESSILDLMTFFVKEYLGLVYYRRGNIKDKDYSKAADIFAEFIKEVEKLPDFQRPIPKEKVLLNARLNYIYCLECKFFFEDGDIDKAIQLVEDSLLEFPLDPELLYHLGRYYFIKKKIKMAEANLNEALEQARKAKDTGLELLILRDLSRLYAEQKEFDLAKSLAREAVAKAPAFKKGEYLYLLGIYLFQEALYKNKDYQEATEVLEEVRQKGIKHRRLFDYLIMAYLNSQRLSEAIDIYKEAKQLYPEIDFERSIIKKIKDKEILGIFLEANVLIKDHKACDSFIRTVATIDLDSSLWIDGLEKMKISLEKRLPKKQKDKDLKKIKFLEDLLRLIKEKRYLEEKRNILEKIKDIEIVGLIETEEEEEILLEKEKIFNQLKNQLPGYLFEDKEVKERIDFIEKEIELARSRIKVDKEKYILVNKALVKYPRLSNDELTYQILKEISKFSHINLERLIQESRQSRQLLLDRLLVELGYGGIKMTLRWRLINKLINFGFDLNQIKRAFSKIKQEPELAEFILSLDKKEECFELIRSSSPLSIEEFSISDKDISCDVDNGLIKQRIPIWVILEDLKSTIYRGFKELDFSYLFKYLFALAKVSLNYLYFRFILHNEDRFNLKDIFKFYTGLSQEQIKKIIHSLTINEKILKAIEKITRSYQYLGYLNESQNISLVLLTRNDIYIIKEFLKRKDIVDVLKQKKITIKGIMGNVFRNGNPLELIIQSQKAKILNKRGNIHLASSCEARFLRKKGCNVIDISRINKDAIKRAILFQNNYSTMQTVARLFINNLDKKVLFVIDGCPKT